MCQKNYTPLTNVFQDGYCTKPVVSMNVSIKTLMGRVAWWTVGRFDELPASLAELKILRDDTTLKIPMMYLPCLYMYSKWW